MKITEEIDKLAAEALQKTQEAEQLAKLAKEFPDLRKHVGRWNKVVYCSASVNDKVMDYETRYNCGCCSDSPKELWPYLVTELGLVYSDPPSFFIGKKDYYAGYKSTPGWQSTLRKANISESFIEKLSLVYGPEEEPEKKPDDDEF